jgi:hypothetical protein
MPPTDLETTNRQPASMSRICVRQPDRSSAALTRTSFLDAWRPSGLSRGPRIPRRFLSYRARLGRQRGPHGRACASAPCVRHTLSAAGRHRDEGHDAGSPTPTRPSKEVDLECCAELPLQERGGRGRIHYVSSEFSSLTAEERRWVVEHEVLWRRAQAIALRNSELDVSGIYHVLCNLQRPPEERLRRGLNGRLRPDRG